MLVELETVERAQRGDAEAFNRIVQAYRKRTLGTIYRLIGRVEDVEDVGQDVFARLYNSLDQLRSPAVFEPWLYRLTRNATYDYLRKRRRSASVRMADISEEQVSGADAALGTKEYDEEQRKGEIRETVQRLFDEISDEDRVLLTLKEVEGLSLRELMEIFNVKESAIKVRLFRARKRALKALQGLKEQGKV